MDIREKLVELLLAVDSVCNKGECGDCGAEDCFIYRAADYLIANGVTVQEWIPVSERLPTKEDANEYGEVLTITHKGIVTVYLYDAVEYYQNDLLYWMPWSALPQPPKGE